MLLLRAATRLQPNRRDALQNILEQAPYASSTINLRLAAVLRLAYEAADRGLLSPDLAAGIRRLKGAKKDGVRLGKWLTARQGKRLLSRV